MMRKQNIFINSKLYHATLLTVASVFSHQVLAESLVANTPANQSDYEPLHQGRIQVNATLFNAPCNLFFDKTLSLTECGAGKAYQKINLSDATAKTPISLRFYDVQRGVSSVPYSLSLLNGSNPIHLPTQMNDWHLLRLEVSYE